MRIISLSVRLFANILAGHLLILFMGGGLAVLLGLTVLGWITLPIAIPFFCLEVGLIATLQAFIFATLTSIYFGEATAGGHYGPLRRINGSGSSDHIRQAADPRTASRRSHSASAPGWARSGPASASATSSAR